MSGIIANIVVAVVSALLAALGAYFIASATSRKSLEDISHAAIRNHNKEFHKDNPWEIMEKHERECLAPPAVRRIERGVWWLVIKNGGNPREIGLTE